MKAKIITEPLGNDLLGLLHGRTFLVKRLIIPKADNLAITVYNGTVMIATNFNLDQTEQMLNENVPAIGKIEILGEVELPEELAQKALAFVQARKELTDLKGQIKRLLE